MDPPLRKRVQLVVRDEDEDEEEADTDFSIDSSGLEQFARMCKSNMRKVLDASSEVQRPSWYMGPITVGLPTEGVDLLQRPEAPKPVVASNRNKDEARAEAEDIAKLQQQAALARREFVDPFGLSGTVGSPVWRHPPARQTESLGSPPGSERSEALSSSRDRTYKSTETFVSEADPDVQVKIPLTKVLNDDGTTITMRNRSPRLPGLVPLQRLQREDEEEVSVAPKHLERSRRRSAELRGSLSTAGSSAPPSDTGMLASTSEAAPPSPSLMRPPAAPPAARDTSPGKHVRRAVREHAEATESSVPPVAGGAQGAEDFAVKRAEEYIALQRSHVRTTDHSLAKVKLLSKQERAQLSARLAKTHPQECERLMARYRARFEPWLAELYAGFNLLFYGIGSKRALLDAFAREVLSGGGPVVVLSGHHPSTTVRTLLNMLSSRDVLGLRQVPADTGAHLAIIAKALEAVNAPHVFILLHGIDGRGLRGRPNQEVLSDLAALEKVHLVASFEHRMTPYAWDTVLVQKFNWLWNASVLTTEPQHVPTYAPYESELRFEQSVGGGATDLISEGAGVLVVLSSVPRSSRTIFRILAEHQLKNPSDKTGITAQRFASLCKDELLCDDATFNAAARELFEHRIFVRNKAPSGELCVRLRMTPTTVSQVLAHLQTLDEREEEGESEDDDGE